MSEPRWIREARKHIGVREIPGRKHNDRILQWWTAIRAPFTDDETPWCAAFVGGILESQGIKSSRSAAARSYAKWGQHCGYVVGAIVVFERGPRNGHVAFLTAVSKDGKLIKCLGGNQGDEVNEKWFPVSRVIDTRWPLGVPFEANKAAKIDVDGPMSRPEEEGGPTKVRPKPAAKPVAPVEDDDAEPDEPVKRPKTWVTEVGTVGTVGTAVETARTAREAINETKDTASDLGLIDMLTSNPKLLILGALLVALIGALAWWQFKKRSRR